MNEGNGPVPSRRALRQRRVVEASQPEAAEPSPEPVMPEPDSVTPEAEVVAPPERESQARARNREAFQAYRSLAEPSSPEEAAPPTRRQLRMRRAEVTEEPTALEPLAQAEETPPAVAPASEVPEPRASDGGPSDDSFQNTGPIDGGRRKRRQASDDSQVAASGLVSPEELTVQQALAAREALIGQAQNQAAALAAEQHEDPFSVDLAVLAEQKALAERAAVLNQRAESMERLARANEQSRSERNDPTTAHNLGMIAPAEYASRPGVDRSVVLRGSSTTHIPVVTGSHPPVPPAHTVTGAVAPAVLPVSAPEVSRRAPQEEFEDAEPENAELLAGPIGAKTAYGLEPLDAVTAAGARIQRHLLTQIAVIGLGAVAIVFGLLMIFGGMGR